MRKPSALASGRRERGGDASKVPSRFRGARRRLQRHWLLVLSTALFAALAIAATTQASSGIVGYFELGSEFEGSLEQTANAKVGDVDVNANGTGAASPGDIYVLGSSVRQLSTSNEFIRMWGANTVKNGPGQANEAQGVRVDATGGTFRLSFEGSTTADLPASASTAQVEAALDGLASIGPGGVSVSGGPGDAGGTAPYIVSFDGASLAGKDQPQMKAEDGSVPLSGGGASVSAYTTNTGGSGFEICEPANGDECRETGPENSGSISVDQSTGDVYITNNNSIEKYTADGKFLRSWGYDVVASGPDDSTNNEVKSVTVKATGGTFTLGYRKSFNAPVQSTPALPYNASAEEVETALDGLEEIGGNYSSVTVTGGPGDLTGSSPYLITFHGLLGGDDLPSDGFFEGHLVSNANALTISSGTKAADVATVADGGGNEICTAANACKEGSSHEDSEGGDLPGAESIRTGSSSLAVAPAGAPNAGDLIVGNQQRRRVQEYTSDGTFVRSFGWDVDQTNPSTGFEVCTAESGDVCQGGTRGSGVGQFGNLEAVAEDSSGAIYALEEFSNPSSPGRVQKFTPAAGLDLTPSPFGTDETQALTVNAGAGQFRLTFGAEPEGTQGIGDVTKGSTTVTNVITTKGEFAVGQILTNGLGNAFEAQIVGIGPHTLTISHPIDDVGFPMGVSTRLEVSLRSDRPYKTGSLSYNASANEVEAALDSLPSINSEGGSVSVTEGPGAPGGSSPYLITFDGGPLARTDPSPIEASNGTTPLSGGSGAGASTAAVTTVTPGGPGGNGRRESAPIDIGVGPGNHVFVAKLFPKVFTKCSDGSSSPYEIRIEELDSSGGVLGTSDPCNGLNGIEGASNRRTSLAVNALTGYPYLLNQNSSVGYPRVNIFGPPGPAPDLSLDPVSRISAESGTISGTVNPNGPGTSYPDTTGTPRVAKTTYRVEFKRSSDPEWTRYTDDAPLSGGTSPVPFSVGVSGLDPATEYELKVVAIKPFTTSVEEARSFTTLPAPPLVEAFSSSDLTASSATLHALINPQGSPTSYHLEYGTTLAYGNSTPEVNIGAGHSAEAAQNQIEDLQDAVYHFRVVATNLSGTTTSEDQTFNFHPPVCPNQTVRQQTGAIYLPDCRAYELVSPENAGGTTLVTGGPQSPYASSPPRLAFVGTLAAIPNSGRNPIETAGDLYVATRGTEGWHTRYVGPSSEEVGCVGGRPLVDGTGTPTTIQNDVMADPSLNRIIDWNEGNPLECDTGFSGGQARSDHNTAALGSNAPYVWDAHGDFIDRWPTSVADAPGTESNFSCPQNPSIHPYPDGFVANIPVSYFCSTFVDASKDLNHFVFSTQSGLYGEGGLMSAPGSAYDNDTTHNTLKLISKQPNGDPIEQEPGQKAGPEELIRFAKVSADGSRVLMATATKPECKQLVYPGATEHPRPLCPLVTQPAHLYMRVNDAVTYDVSQVPVHYIGATSDATKVYFTSDEQLTTEDTDSSTDLYMWSENDGHPTLTLTSKGEANAGNDDDCVASWTARCNIKTYDDTAISSTPGNRGGLGSWTDENSNPGYTDNAIAANSGDIYFYSPDQLVAGKGTPGQENLYVYRDGAVHHVATLADKAYCIKVDFETTCSNGAVGRIQVTPDGRFAAFVTTSRLTAYDNHGFAEMYRYDADAEKLQCVSCRPDGSAPEGDVLGSHGGRFITDEGRVFFESPEPLVPSDTNGGHGSFGERFGSDVYEFVDGRPQLITSGTGGLRIEAGISGVQLTMVGLYGVSANGVDVYFGTFETLVGQDHNGQQLKFYDARTNGGFAFVPPSAPCAAADECHGPTTQAPAPLLGGTVSALGDGGNASRAKEHKRRHKRKLHKGRRREGRRAAVKQTGHKLGGGR